RHLLALQVDDLHDPQVREQELGPRGVEAVGAEPLRGPHGATRVPDEGHSPGGGEPDLLAARRQTLEAPLGGALVGLEATAREVEPSGAGARGPALGVTAKGRAGPRGPRPPVLEVDPAD